MGFFYIRHLSRCQADKLKAALIQYKQSQPPDSTDKQSIVAAADHRTPDVNKNEVSMKANVSSSKNVRQSSTAQLTVAAHSRTPKTNEVSVYIFFHLHLIMQ